MKGVPGSKQDSLVISSRRWSKLTLMKRMMLRGGDMNAVLTMSLHYIHWMSVQCFYISIYQITITLRVFLYTNMHATLKYISSQIQTFPPLELIIGAAVSCYWLSRVKTGWMSGKSSQPDQLRCNRLQLYMKPNRKVAQRLDQVQPF